MEPYGVQFAVTNVSSGNHPSLFAKLITIDEFTQTDTQTDTKVLPVITFVENFGCHSL